MFVERFGMLKLGVKLVCFKYEMHKHLNQQETNWKRNEYCWNEQVHKEKPNQQRKKNRKQKT